MASIFDDILDNLTKNKKTTTQSSYSNKLSTNNANNVVKNNTSNKVTSNNISTTNKSNSSTSKTSVVDKVNNFLTKYLTTEGVNSLPDDSTWKKISQSADKAANGTTISLNSNNIGANNGITFQTAKNTVDLVKSTPVYQDIKKSVDTAKTTADLVVKGVSAANKARVLNGTASPIQNIVQKVGQGLNKVDELLLEGASNLDQTQQHHLDTTFSAYVDKNSVYDKIKNDAEYGTKLVDVNSGEFIDYSDQIEALQEKIDNTPNPYERKQYNEELNTIKQYETDQKTLLYSSYYDYLVNNGASDEQLNEFKKAIIRSDNNGIERALTNFGGTVSGYVGNTLKGIETLYAKTSNLLGVDYQMGGMADKIINDAEYLQALTMGNAGDVEKFVYEVYDGMAPFLYALATAGIASGSVVGNQAAAQQLMGNALLISDVGVLGSQAKKNMEEGYDFDTSFNNALLHAALNHITESIGGESLANILTGEIGEKMLENTTDYVIRSLANQFIAEATEEGAEAVVSPIIDNLSLNKGITVQEYMDEVLSKDTLHQMLIGGLGGLVMGTGATFTTINSYNSQINELANSIDIKTKEDYDSAGEVVNNLNDIVNSVESKLSSKKAQGIDTSVDESQIFASRQLIKAYRSKMAQYMSENPYANAFTSTEKTNVGLDQNARQDILNAAKPTLNSAMTDIINTKEQINENSQKAVDALSAKLVEQGIDASAVDATKLTDESVKQMQIVNEYAKATKKDVAFADMVGKDGDIIDGLHDSQSGKILINPNAKRGALSTLVHEFTHGTESSKYYGELQRLVEEYYGDNFEARKNYIKNNYSTLVNLSDEGATKELVAVTTQNLLGNQEYVNRLVKYDTSLAYRMYEEIKYLNDNTGTVADIEQNFMRAFSDSDNQFIVSEETGTAAPSLSYRTWQESDKNAIAKDLSDKIDVPIEKAKKWINDVNSVAKIIATDKQRYDYSSNDNYTALKPNSDYDYTVDFSTLCKKRIKLQGTVDSIQNKLSNQVLNSEDYIRIRQMMAERGYEVSCGYCYVESARRHLGDIAKTYIDGLNAISEGKDVSIITNEKGKNLFNKNQIALLNNIKEQIPVENLQNIKIEDLLTIDGVNNLQSSEIGKQIYQGFVSFNGARGQARDMLVQNRVQYNGEIMNISNSKVQSLIDNGGLRLQSYSDFETPHLIDMMQVVIDMSRRGLTSQAYTKVGNFADSMGETGIKINMSLIADGVDENGNLIFNDVEGMPHDEAFAIRDKHSKNVGTIIVGKNDDVIKSAMSDERIDYIIPFHKSGWANGEFEALGISGFDNYTDEQHERDISTGKFSKEDLLPVKYWDFSVDGDTNAKNYLQLCAEDGRIPKFHRFLQDNGDGTYSYNDDGSSVGYWKMLTDFKMYDNEGVGSPQLPVQPIFDNKVNRRIMNEYEGGHRINQVAQDVVDDFIKEKESGIQFSKGISDLDDAKFKTEVKVANEMLGIDQDQDYWDNLYETVDDMENNLLNKSNNPYENDQKYWDSLEETINQIDGTKENLNIEDAKEGATKILDDQKPKRKINEVKDDAKKIIKNFVNKSKFIWDLSRKTKNDNLYPLYNQVKNSRSVADRLIYKKGGLADILNEIPQEYQKDFSYMVYHGVNIDAAKINKPVFPDFTSEQSEQIVNQTLLEHPEWKQTWDKIINYEKGLKQKLVDSGRITQQTSDLWDKMYPHYVHVVRDINNVEDTKTVDPKVMSTNKGAVKQRKGGNQNLKSLRDAVTEHTYQVAKSASMNEFAKEYNKVSHLKASDEFKNALSFDDLRNTIGDEIRAADENTPAQLLFVDGGDFKVLEIPNELYDVFNEESKLPNNSITQTLNKVNDFRRNLITGWNLTFSVRNIIKDTQDMFYKSEHPAQTFANIPKAMVGLAMSDKSANSKLYQLAEDWRDLGGGSNNISKVYDGTKFYNATIGAIERLNNYIESVPRFAEFMASLEKGRTPTQAMYDSDKVTTNFKMGGEYTKWLDRNGFTFLNASVEGFNEIVQSYESAYDKNGWKGVLGKMAISTLVLNVPLMVLNHLLWKDDEDYQKLSDYIKDNYYIIYKNKDGTFFRIPKGRIAAAYQGVLNSIYDSGVELASDDSAKEKAVSLWENTLDAIGTAWDNIGVNNPFKNNLLSPIIDVMNNRTWYGDDLLSDYELRKDASQQYDYTTDKGSVLLGQALNLSPKKINYLVDQYSGGLGDIILPMLTPKAETNLNDGTLIGGVASAVLSPAVDDFVTDPIFKNQNVSDLFDMEQELAKEATKENASDDVKLASKYLTAAKYDMYELYGERSEIFNDETLTDAQKYEKARVVQKKIDDIAKYALDTYDNIDQEGNYASMNSIDFYKDDDGEWNKIDDETSEEMKSLNMSTSQKATYESIKENITKTNKVNTLLNYYNQYDEIKNSNVSDSIKNKRLSELNEKIENAEKKFTTSEIEQIKKQGSIDAKEVNFSSIMNSNLSDEQKNYMYDKYYNSTIGDYINDLNISESEKLNLKYSVSTAEGIKNSKGSTVSNSKALAVANEYAKAGVLDDVFNYIKENNMKPTDLGLSKTVFNYTYSQMAQDYENMFGNKFGGDIEMDYNTIDNTTYYNDEVGSSSTSSASKAKAKQKSAMLKYINTIQKNQGTVFDVLSKMTSMSDAKANAEKIRSKYR